MSWRLSFILKSVRYVSNEIIGDLDLVIFRFGGTQGWYLTPPGKGPWVRCG